MKNILRLSLFVCLCLISVIPSFAKKSNNHTNTNKGTTVLPITGTWVNLAYKDVRNKYTNPQYYDNTDPQLWEAKIAELSKMGIEYLVMMEVANEGKAYYPSQLMAPLYDSAKMSPVDAILDAAEEHHMKVFLSTGWAKDQDDNLQNPAIKKRQIEIMEELSSLYAHHKAFYGWYLPVEDCLCPILSEHAVQAVNSLTDKARQLTPGKKILISPYGIGLSEFDNPQYEKQLAKLKVDIIAYQDEVGCVRDKFTLPRLKQNWKRIRDIHNRLNIELWANCETFTWEEGTNDRQSALIPAAYPRLLAQQAAASAAPVDRIISFMFGGIIEDPQSKYQLGQPIWSNLLYTNYQAWRKGAIFWKRMQDAIMGNLKNGVSSSMIADVTSASLIDSQLGEENADDKNWSHFEKGFHALNFNLKQPTVLKEVFVRLLNYAPYSVGVTSKMYLSTSTDGVHYHLVAIKDVPAYPNNKYDAWVEGVLFDNLKEKVSNIRLEFDAPQKVYIDEVFINPVNQD